MSVTLRELLEAAAEVYEYDDEDRALVRAWVERDKAEAKKCLEADPLLMQHLRSRKVIVDKSTKC